MYYIYKYIYVIHIYILIFTKYNSQANKQTIYCNNCNMIYLENMDLQDLTVLILTSNSYVLPHFEPVQRLLIVDWERSSRGLRSEAWPRICTK